MGISGISAAERGQLQSPDALELLGEDCLDPWICAGSVHATISL